MSVTTVQRVVTIALAVILFDGGMQIGWRRFRQAAGAVVWVGVAGTFVTAAALAVLAHTLFGLEWRTALLLGTALAPTDPAAVFSVLGRREVSSRSGTILEGESGANDPVAIALMASLLTAGQTFGLGAAGGIAGEFLLQLAVGAVVGVAGGVLLVGFMRRVPRAGGLVPAVAARLRVPMRPAEPEPWSLGVRFRHEPRGLRRFLVAAGSPADGCTIGDLAIGEDVWISVVIRGGQLVPVRGSTVLRAGDEILALTDPEQTQDLASVFTAAPGPPDLGSDLGSASS